METKQLPGLSKYELRSDGEIISYWSGEPRVIVGGSDKDGYRKFVLIDDTGSRRYVRRASLVCAAFHGPRPKGKEVRHLDGSRTNDAASNLEWSTHRDNIADKLIHGTTQRGTVNGNSKITEERAIQVKRMFALGHTGPEVMFHTGVSRSIVYQIKYGKTWAWL